MNQTVDRMDERLGAAETAVDENGETAEQELVDSSDKAEEALDEVAKTVPGLQIHMSVLVVLFCS